MSDDYKEKLGKLEESIENLENTSEDLKNTSEDLKNTSEDLEKTNKQIESSVEDQFGYLTFVIILIIVIVSWILVELWKKVIDNFAYNTLGMDKNSTVHSLIVAVTITLIFVVVVIFMKDKGLKIHNNLMGLTPSEFNASNGNI